MSSLTYQPALRSNIARTLTGLAHRDFCARLADSHILQWFLHVGEVDSVKVFAKSSSDRLGKWVGADSMRFIHEKFPALLAATAPGGSERVTPSEAFGLPAPVSYDDIFFDSSCLKAEIHFPIDWVCTVIATASRPESAEWCRKMGAQHVIDHSGDWPAESPR